MAGVAFLWCPRSNNTRCGYAEFFTEDPNEDSTNNNQEELVQLETLNSIGGGDLSHRKRGTDETQQQEGNKSQEPAKPKVQTETSENLSDSLFYSWFMDSVDTGYKL